MDKPQADPSAAAQGQKPKKNAGGPNGGKRKQPPKPAAPVAPAAGGFKKRKRHILVAFSFCALVALPLLIIFLYLSLRAADQYESKVGFTVRTEESASVNDVFGSFSGLTGGSSSDADILYAFIQSQEIVQTITSKIDLTTIYSKPENDPIFSYDPDGSIEDLVDYWQKMVKIFYNSSTGLISLRVLAFDPDDAQNIATEIVDASTVKINALSAISRADATRYAQEDLDSSLILLKSARRALTDFRNKHQIVDPEADIAGKVGLLNSLQVQLADALIGLDLLLQTTSNQNDARVEQVRRRISVIQERITEERKQFGASTNATGDAFSTIVGDYEELLVDVEFAEQAYLGALSTFNSAKAEAQRKSRYLAAYIQPTRAESSTYPRQGKIMGLSALFLFLAWAIAVLLGYAIKDRR